MKQSFILERRNSGMIRSFRRQPKASGGNEGNEADFDDGPLVKRLRRGPLTPQTWVRFPHGSPKLVSMTTRVHPFPFRTRKLSSSVATILVWRRTGKIARCQHRCSSIAQSVEHAAVNRGVVGSSPTWGAKWRAATFRGGFPFLRRPHLEDR